MIPHSRPFFDAEDERALAGALRRRFVTHGEAAERLGREGARLVGKAWGIAVQSGTDALTAALRLLDVGTGDRVALSSYLCGAPLDALAATGARPVLVDADRATLALDVDAVNRLTDIDGVIAAHLFGRPAPVGAIACNRLIEDCAQTLAVRAGDRPVGAWGALSVCSFYGTKLVTSGHGGLLAGDDPVLERAARDLFTHDGREQWRPHLHYFMSDLAAALGLSQLAKIDRFLGERRVLAERYTEALGGNGIDPDCAYARFLVVAENAGAMIASFHAAGIEAKRPVYKPLHLLLGLPPEEFPNATWAHEHIVSVPVYPGIAAEDSARIAAFLREHAHALRCWPPG